MLSNLKRVFEKMREGLRSHTRRTAEKEMIDLNKDPVEDDGSSSKSPPSSAYFSAEEKVDSGLDVDVDSSNAAGGKGTRGKKGEIFNHGEISGALEGNVGCASPLTNDGLVREGLSESRPLEGNRDAATVGALDLNATSSGVKTKDEAAGRGRRGRKRKMVGSGLSNAGGLEEASVKKEGCEEDYRFHEVLEQGQGVDMSADAACALPLPDPVLVNQGSSEFRSLEAHEDAATFSVLDPNASSGVIIKGEAAHKGQRGRKRKMVGCGLFSAQSLKGGSVMEEEIVTVARAEEDCSKHEVLEHGHDADVGTNVAAASAGNTDKDRQESSKNRRGRKRKVLESSGVNKDKVDAGGESKRLALDGTPQIVGRVLRSRTREANAAEKQACTEKEDLGDKKGEMELETSGTRNVEMEMEIEKSARPAINLKRGRGRPPKMHGRNGSNKVTVNNKTNIGSQKKFSLPGAKVVKGHKLVKLHKRKVTSAFLKVHKGNNIDKKEGDMRRKEEKQLLKEQIISILKEAGWTIEYRPRNGRDYLDAVYVDGHGRTHWSVTLAYNKLKQKIEDGTADDKEISAFTPIPGDQLSKLFRITQEGKKCKKGLKAGGTGNGGSKERPDRKSARECVAVSKTKANITSGRQQGEKSLEKRIEGVNSEQENSMMVSCMRKPKSRRGGSRKPCGLFARESKDELTEGKRTLLSWMIDLGTISAGDKVQYMSHERIDAAHEGKITREGICCDCCGKIFTLVDFECHTGSLLGQPLQNIRLESGKSLLQCMSESWSKQEEIDHIGFNFVNVENDPDDDTCNICADGGDLICCDSCPATFHQSCLQIQNFPTGDWHCIYCSCKFCGMVCWANSKGVNVLDSNDPGYFTCLFCEEKFHVNCMLMKEDKSINTELPFCGRGCQKLFENLQKLLGVKHELGKGYSWTILRRQDLSCATDSSKVENNSKLAIAFSIIDECFTPITDERSSIDLIRSVCYSCGSNLRRLNYSGFCTFILEKNDELVSAATIRVHGNQLAEMPFIGTRGIHRRKGMCRLLLTAIEMVLSSLDVEKLVIPAVSELNETWTKVFGFVPLEESRTQEMMYMSLVVFPGTDLLQKPLCKYHVTEGETSAAGANLSQPSNDHMNGNTNPTDDTSAATVGSGLHITCDDLNHGVRNGLANSITSKDELCHDFDTSEVELETSKSPEGNQVDKISCVPEEGKEALQSQHKTAVCSQ